MELTTTCTEQLRGLEDRQNEQAWSEFCRRYAPVLTSFGRRLGLNEEDSRDAAQDALLAFAEAYKQGKYEREKGRLRTWLLGIATKKIRDVQRRQVRHAAQGGHATEGTDLIHRVPDDHALGDIWEEEWRQSVLDACLVELRKQVEPRTMRAFELLVLKEWPTERVADELGMTRGALYQTKNRVLTQLRKIRKQLNRDW
jgi:RNA polymerase sigma-70 factor (ECF subfamily)